MVQGIIVSVMSVVIMAGNINEYVRGSAEDFENLYWGYDFGLEKRKNHRGSNSGRLLAKKGSN